MRFPIALSAGWLSYLLLMNLSAFAQPVPRLATSDSLEVAATRSLDEQVAELQRTMASAEVVRVGGSIRLTFATNVLFAPNEADLRPTAWDALGKMVEVLQRYPPATLLVTANPDTTADVLLGSSLAQQQAKAVRSMAMSKGVRPECIQAQAYDASLPGVNRQLLLDSRTTGQLEITIEPSLQSEEPVNNSAL